MRWTRGLAAAAMIVLVMPSPAHADTQGHWAQFTDWDGTAKTGTVVIDGPTGFPSAALQTTSAGPAGPATGASTWLAASTDPGAVYGSNRTLPSPYISLRPAGNNVGAPSTSTYTFAHPTPTAGWSFTLGDIDAEYLDISATDPAGNPVPIADLGFRSSFNYCLGAGTPSCDPGKAQPNPLWDPATGRLAGPELDGTGAPIPGWSDTDGAAAWFEPRVALGSLTVTATFRIGSPIYQTWFSALSRDASGTVAGTDECSAAGLDVVLTDAAGTEVARTTTDAAGAWSLPNLATYDDWTATISAPAGCEVVDSALRPVDVSVTDAVVDVVLAPVAVPPGPDPDPGTGSGGAPGAPGAGAPQQVLPTVGVESAWLGVAGAALLAAGVALVARARRHA